MGFSFIFILSALAFLVAGKHQFQLLSGLEVVFWALIFGLLISNFFGVPGMAQDQPSRQNSSSRSVWCSSERKQLFSTIVKVGAYGMIQSIIVIGAVFYVCFWVAKKLGLDDEFASILGTAVSICGVSAAIAAGGAVKGDPEEGEPYHLPSSFSAPFPC